MQPWLTENAQCRSFPEISTPMPNSIWLSVWFSFATNAAAVTWCTALQDQCSMFYGCIYRVKPGPIPGTRLWMGSLAAPAQVRSERQMAHKSLGCHRNSSLDSDSYSFSAAAAVQGSAPGSRGLQLHVRTLGCRVEGPQSEAWPVDLCSTRARKVQRGSTVCGRKHRGSCWSPALWPPVEAQTWSMDS